MTIIVTPHVHNNVIFDYTMYICANHAHAYVRPIPLTLIVLLPGLTYISGSSHYQRSYY